MKGDRISFTLCMLVAICMIGLLTYHVVKDPVSAQPTQPEYEFRLACVEDLQMDSISGSFEIYYFVDSLDSTIVISTSLLEGDMLKVLLDTHDNYVYEQRFDKVDSLDKLVDEMSMLKYIDNQYYKGFIWVCELGY